MRAKTRDSARSISRRDFLGKASAAAATAMAAPYAAMAGAPGKAERPNILYLMTDQQHAGMLGCAGNTYLNTPAMDGLAATGVRFEKAYCTNPVCLPSRVGMLTGHMPGEFEIRSNAGPPKPMPESIVQEAMGWIFRRAGYETGYGGKVHLPRGMTPESMGFGRITGDQRSGLAAEAAAFVRQPREKPFLLVASFINPHDICYMAINDFAKKPNTQGTLTEALQLPEGVATDEFYEKLCPPLPDNYEVPPLEPECITTALLQGRSFRAHARNTWTDRQWRLHRWAYCRLTEMVDAQIGKILAAVREAGLQENTLIIFSSDHGDMDGAHRMEHKTVLYEEAARIPFILSYQGVTRPGLVDDAHLVSNGLDLIPTICDYAGIEPPQGLRGRSLRELAEGRQPGSWRDELVVESQVGRMLRTARYKYNVYESGAHREQLIDLENDPGDMVNLAEDAAYRDVLVRHRRQLRRQVELADDEIGKQYVPKA